MITPVEKLLAIRAGEKVEITVDDAREILGKLPKPKPRQWPNSGLTQEQERAEVERLMAEGKGD